MYTKLTGSLQSIIAYANNLVKGQVIVDNTEVYEIYINNDLLPFLENLILNRLNYKKTIKNKYVEALIFDLEKATLWDSNKINWVNKNESQYLITENDIEADNLTVYQFLTIASQQLEIPFIIHGNYNKTSKHDWQLHFRYFNLMAQSLKDDFGILVEQKQQNVPHYYLTKKSP